VKCPNCGYVSFDIFPQCRRCGAELPRGAALPDNLITESKASSMEHGNNAEDTPKLPPQWNDTIQLIKKELEEIEGKPVGRVSHTIESQKAETSAMSDNAPDVPRIAPIKAIRKGGFMLRLLAYMIDSTIINLLTIALLTASYLVVNFLTFDMLQHEFYGVTRLLLISYLFTGTLIDLFYFTYCHAVTGQTIGKWVCGLKVVTTDGKLLGFGRSLLRWAGYYISRFAFGLGFFWIAISIQKQGWHDMLAGSYVIRV
jgi:uncharacterized RDD family membrane protein YckC